MLTATRPAARRLLLATAALVLGTATFAVADLGRQREPVLPSSLAADHQLPGPPVHVGKLQAGDLDRAQTQPRDQQHDREVADADVAAAIDAVTINHFLRAFLCGFVNSGDRSEYRTIRGDQGQCQRTPEI